MEIEKAWCAWGGGFLAEIRSIRYVTGMVGMCVTGSRKFLAGTPRFSKPRFRIGPSPSVGGNAAVPEGQAVNRPRNTVRFREGFSSSRLTNRKRRNKPNLAEPQWNQAPTANRPTAEPRTVSKLLVGGSANRSLAVAAPADGNRLLRSRAREQVVSSSGIKRRLPIDQRQSRGR